MVDSIQVTSSVLIPPTYGLASFNCPHCLALAHQRWYADAFGRIGSERLEVKNCAFGQCTCCGQITVWWNHSLIFPPTIGAPQLIPDCPENVRKIAEEARAVYNTSPRAAAAILRLALQVFMKETLALPGSNINSEIAELVKQGRITSRIQKAMDILRVIGNNAVHPGQIDFEEDTQVAFSLFGLLNLIVEETITRDKHIDALYENLPPSIKNQIEERNAKSIAAP